MNTKNISLRAAGIVLITTTVMLSGGCSTTTIVEPFYRPEGARVEQAYISPDADFSVYSKLLAQPLEIYYPTDAPAPSEDELDRLRQIFRDAFLGELADDYEIVEEPGPDVLIVLAQIVDLKVTGPRVLTRDISSWLESCPFTADAADEAGVLPASELRLRSS